MKGYSTGYSGRNRKLWHTFYPVESQLDLTQTVVVEVIQGETVHHALELLQNLAITLARTAKAESQLVLSQHAECTISRAVSAANHLDLSHVAYSYETYVRCVDSQLNLTQDATWQQ
jgi:hypothetical protein